MREWRHGPGAPGGASLAVVIVNGPKKIRFLTAIILGLTLAASCSSRRVEHLESASGSKVSSSTPPFQTKEPDRYQAIRSVTFASAAGAETTMTNAIAKDGQMRREEDTIGTKRVVYLDLPTGRYVLLPEERLYASVNEDVLTQNPPDTESDGSGEFYLHTGPVQSTYEKIGNEDVDGRTTTKYRVVVNISGAGTVSNGETLIWVDETLGMPVKSVTTSTGGTRTVELSRVSLEVENGLFQIPPHFQKIETRALRDRLR